jgi:hypothetical protein
MRRLARHRPSPALLVAVLALVLATAGTSFGADAVSAVAKKIKGKQIASNAITSAKVKNGSLLLQDFKSSERRKLKGAKGDTGAPGAAGAKGDKGDKGDPGPLLETLPSGKTLRGYYAVGAPASGSGVVAVSGVTFQFPLASAPEVHFIKSADSVPAGCSGTAVDPGADPGHLCVFEIRAFNVSSVRGIQTGNSVNGAFRWGFGVYAFSKDPGPEFDSTGSWAVTAP